MINITEEQLKEWHYLSIHSEQLYEEYKRMIISQLQDGQIYQWVNIWGPNNKNNLGKKFEIILRNGQWYYRDKDDYVFCGYPLNIDWLVCGIRDGVFKLLEEPRR